MNFHRIGKPGKCSQNISCPIHRPDITFHPGLAGNGSNPGNRARGKLSNEYTFSPRDNRTRAQGDSMRNRYPGTGSTMARGHENRQSMAGRIRHYRDHFPIVRNAKNPHIAGEFSQYGGPGLARSLHHRNPHHRGAMVISAFFARFRAMGNCPPGFPRVCRWCFIQWGFACSVSQARASPAICAIYERGKKR